MIGLLIVAGLAAFYGLIHAVAWLGEYLSDLNERHEDKRKSTR